MAARDTFSWLDVELIGEMLAEEHADVDPLGVTFPQLKGLVMGLAGFREEAGHPVNEKILEHIQAAWIEERGGGRRAGDED